MGKQIKVLFTCVGRRVELVQAFKRAGEKLGLDVGVFGIDSSNLAPALYFCDGKRRVCAIDDWDYVDDIVKMCTDEGIDIVIPTIDTDLLLLAYAKPRFEEVGTRLLLSDLSKILMCRDKRKIGEFFSSCGLPTPETVDNIGDFKLEYPCFIKPADGSASQNAFVVNGERDLNFYIDKVPNYIIQPYIEGTEFTVDIMCDFEGDPIFITPRKRLRVRSGEVMLTQIDYAERILEECKIIIGAFKPCGPLTVQLIKSRKTGENYYIEINPRFGGGVPLTMKGGADSAEAILRLLTGEKIGYQEYAVDNRSVYSRFDQSIRL